MLADIERQKFEIRKRKELRFAKGEPKRVALELRVSSYKQATNGEVPDVPIQREQLLEFIKTQNWIPAMKNGKMIEYLEISSAYKKSRHDREAIVQAIKSAEQDEYDILLFFKSDRLSRISKEYPTIISDLWDMGIEPWDYQQKQALRMKTQSDKLMRFVEGWQGESESVNTSFRVTENMQALARQGMWLGGKNPYGYHYNEPEILTKQNKEGKNKLAVRKGIVIDIEEAKIVILIFELYIKGYGSTKICKILNNPPYNIRKRNGKPIDHTMVLSILKNPIYIGIITWGKTSLREKFFQRIPKKDWMIAEKQEQYRIIPDEVFIQAQEILLRNSEQVIKGKKISRRTLGSERLLAGLAFCGYCEEPMLSKTYTNPAKNYKREGYTCRSHKRKSPCESKRHFIEKDILENAVLSVIEQVINKILTTNKDEILKEFHDKYHSDINNNSNETTKINQKIKELKKLKDYYVTEHQKIIIGIETEVPKEIIINQLQKVSEELKQMEKTINIYEQQQKAKPLSLSDIDKLFSEISNWIIIFKEVDLTHQRKLLSDYINKVLVFDDYITVHLIIGHKEFVQTIPNCAFNDVEECLGYIKSTILDKIQNTVISVSSDKPIRINSKDYWDKVKEWEDKEQKPFGFIIGELRRGMAPEEVINKLGISRGFIYYNFGKYMDKISFLETKHEKLLSDLICDWRGQGLTMDNIAEVSGLAKTTLYNYLRKKRSDFTHS